MEEKGPLPAVLHTVEWSVCVRVLLGRRRRRRRCRRCRRRRGRSGEKEGRPASTLGDGHLCSRCEQRAPVCDNASIVLCGRFVT